VRSAAVYEWHVVDPARARTLSTHDSVDAAFEARTGAETVHLVFKATGYRARVLRAGTRD
jgi:hypothetical protein